MCHFGCRTMFANQTLQNETEIQFCKCLVVSLRGKSTRRQGGTLLVVACKRRTCTCIMQNRSHTFSKGNGVPSIIFEHLRNSCEVARFFTPVGWTAVCNCSKCIRSASRQERGLMRPNSYTHMIVIQLQLHLKLFGS